MAKLTLQEITLIDNYIISNNFIELDQAHFISALGRVVPTWRLEQLVGNETVYNNSISPCYIDYLNSIHDKTNKML